MSEIPTVTEGFRPTAVDWAWIEKQEGKLILHGYVPVDRDGNVIGHSGVTIASGFDIGQRSIADLLSLNIPQELAKKLSSFTLKTGQSAKEFLSANPLTITEDEALILDAMEKQDTLSTVLRIFKRDTGRDFASLSPRVQTVIADLAFNFGARIDKSLPETWAIICKCDEQSLKHWLQSFPSKNPELKLRRLREADLLQGTAETSGR